MKKNPDFGSSDPRVPRLAKFEYLTGEFGWTAAEANDADWIAPWEREERLKKLFDRADVDLVFEGEYLESSVRHWPEKARERYSRA